MDPTIDITRWINQQKIGWVQVMVLVLSGACALLEGFDALNIAFVAPAVVHDWHLPPHSFTPAFMAGLAGLLVGCLFIAPLADKFGRKRVMLGSVVAFAIFSALSAAAFSLTSLSILRFLTGVGVGGGMANAIALTSEFFPERKRASMTVIMFVGFPLGGGRRVPLRLSHSAFRLAVGVSRRRDRAAGGGARPRFRPAGIDPASGRQRSLARARDQGAAADQPDGALVRCLGGG